MTTPPAQGIGLATKKILALAAGGGTMMGVGAIARVRAEAPDADGTSFMRRDLAEAKEYYTGFGKGVMLPTIAALLCVSVLYGRARTAMLGADDVAKLSSDAQRAAMELGKPFLALDANGIAAAEPSVLLDSAAMRRLPPAAHDEIVNAGDLPVDKRELLYTQVTYGLGGAGLFGGLLNTYVTYGDVDYDTRHFPKDADITVTRND